LLNTNSREVRDTLEADKRCWRNKLGIHHRDKRYAASYTTRLGIARKYSDGLIKRAGFDVSHR
jgi:hypothetical protein